MEFLWVVLELVLQQEELELQLPLQVLLELLVRSSGSWAYWGGFLVLEHSWVSQETQGDVQGLVLEL